MSRAPINPPYIAGAVVRDSEIHSLREASRSTSGGRNVLQTRNRIEEVQERIRRKREFEYDD
jgi:hypothetical protein